MSAPGKNIPLTVVSNTANNFWWAQIGVGNNILTQQQQSGGPYYWFVVINRYTLAIEYNQLQTQPNLAPNIGNLNTSDHILVVATLGVGLNNPPQGALFAFLDINGAGAELRRVEQVAEQFNCGSLGTFGYALVGVLGNQNVPGFEASEIGRGTVGPILTVQLMPTTYGGQTIYTPVQLSNA
jgi:hypothetical protein